MEIILKSRGFQRFNQSLHPDRYHPSNKIFKGFEKDIMYWCDNHHFRGSHYTDTKYVQDDFGSLVQVYHGTVKLPRKLEWEIREENVRQANTAYTSEH